MVCFTHECICLFWTTDTSYQKMSTFLPLSTIHVKNFSGFSVLKMIITLTVRRSGNDTMCDTLLQTLQLRTVSVTSFPECLAQLCVTYHTESQAATWKYFFPRSYTPTQSTGLSQQLYFIQSYKFSCKTGYSCPLTGPTEQNAHIMHRVDKEVAYKQCQVSQKHHNGRAQKHHNRRAQKHHNRRAEPLAASQ